MDHICGYVRPYPGRLGSAILRFVEDQGFTCPSNMVVPRGASDERVARFAQREPMDLLLIPFHLHRSDEGAAVDGIGALLSLPVEEKLGGRTVFMPVRSFSWGASFQRRLDALRAERPDLAMNLLIAHQDEIGTATLVARLNRAAEASRYVKNSSGPPRNQDAHGTPAALRRSDSVPEPVAQERFSLVPTRRPSLPASRRRLNPGADESSEDRAVSSRGLAFGERQSHKSELSGPESARANFRRAAEIGAKAREEAGLPPSRGKKRRGA